MELSQLFERVFTDDVGVEDEEWRVILSENFLCQFQGTRGTKRLRLDGEFNVDIILFSILIEKRLR